MKKFFRYFVVFLFVFTILSLVVLPLNKSGKDKDSDEKTFVDFSQLSYVAFGDSITEGVDGIDWGLMEKPYPVLVKETLNLASVDNRGVSGSTFCPNTLGRTNMTQRILKFYGDADIISVMLGVNDYCVNLPLGTTSDIDNTTIYGSLHMIAKHFRKNYSESFCFFMTPFKKENGTNINSQGYTLEDVANAIKYIGNKFEIPVLDMYTYGNYEVEMNLPESDGLHPSQEFMKKYCAPKIVRFIKDNYK